MSKRDELREKRRKQQSSQRIFWIIGIVVIAVAIAGVLIYPSLTPIGDIKASTPLTRPNVNGLAMGDPNAKVKIELFSDFQCPACKNFLKNNEATLISTYVATGKVYVKYAPLSFIGPESVSAAEAAYCASDQGKFWEYHDMLFANQTGENIGDFTNRRLAAFAQKIGLNMSQFNSCFNGGKYKLQVQKDEKYGETTGVMQTPTLFINGVIPTGDQMQAVADAVKAAGG